MSRIHVAVCDHCGRRIAWSRKRRQWLAFFPTSGPTQLQRRLRCPESDADYHDPSGNLAEIADERLRVLFGGER